MKKLLALIGLIPFATEADVVDQLLAETTAKLNKHIPLQVDEETRLDGVSAENKTLIYEYTLLNYEKAELNLEILKSNIAPVVKKGACTEASMKPLFDSGINVHYHYKGKHGESLMMIKVISSDCKNEI